MRRIPGLLCQMATSERRKAKGEERKRSKTLTSRILSTPSMPMAPPPSATSAASSLTPTAPTLPPACATWPLPSRIFNGKLDEVAVFNYTLSPAQIAQLYSTALTGGPRALRVQRFDGSLLLSWVYGTLLAAANSATGPWAPVFGAAPPSYTVSPAEAQMFYRVLVECDLCPWAFQSSALPTELPSQPIENTELG